MRISKDMNKQMTQNLYELKGTHAEVKKFAHVACYRNNNEWDTFLAVTGDKGTGKSNFAIQQARAYVDVMKEKYNKHVEFDEVENIVYSSTQTEIFEKIEKTKKKGVIIFDEAARFILGEDWNTKESKKSKKMWGEIRTKNLFVIFVLPFNFDTIDSKYRKSLINFWVDCVFRGHALIFEKTRNGFFAKQLYDKCGVGLLKWSDGISKDSIRKKLQRIKSTIQSTGGISSSFQGFITWRKIPNDIAETYYKHRDEKVYEEKEKEDEKEVVVNRYLAKEIKYKIKLLEICTKRFGVSQQEIAEILEISSSTISRWKKKHKEMQEKIRKKDN